MKLERIKVERLFGTFDHEIELNADPTITLVLGRNGLGKTILLKMLSAVFTNNLEYLCQIKFKTFTLYFELGNKLLISRMPKKFYELKFEFNSYKGRIVETNSRALKIEQNSFKQLQGLIQNSRSFRESYFNAILHSDEFSLKDKVDLIDGLNDTDIVAPKKEVFEKYPNWLKDIMNSYKGHLISTERIIKTFAKETISGSKYERAINECSKDFLERLGNALNESSALSVTLDRSFPNRIIRTFEDNQEITSNMLEELFEGLTQLQKKQNLLQKTGIQNDSILDLPLDFKTMHSETYKILSVYVKDSLEKLKPYESLANKLQLFLDIINNKLLFKRVLFTQGQGFSVISTKTDDVIPLHELSSGEQHLFVLFYQMLFLHDSNSLLLIDEPEISLHVGWQKHFVDDLMDVLKLNPMTVIMATHSPTLIGPYWNLTSELHYDD